MQVQAGCDEIELIWKLLPFHILPVYLSLFQDWNLLDR